MNLENFKNKTAKILLEIKAINIDIKKHFKLTSGKFSPVYVDCRKIISFVKERNIILNYIKDYLENNEINFDLLAGGETAGIPYAAMLSEQFKKKMIYVRKKPKGFGKNQQIEGSFKKNEKKVFR